MLDLSALSPEVLTARGCYSTVRAAHEELEIMKTCKLCGTKKPLSSFYKAVGCRDNVRPECKGCFLQKVAKPRQSARTRLEKKFQVTPGCWIWTASKRGKGGYGGFGLSGKVIGAHRASYQIYVGPIPDGLDVCHKCDNRACVNPDHLFLGTNHENVIDRHSKGRSKLPNNKGTSNGMAKLTSDDVMRIRADKRLHYEIALDYGVSRQTIGDIKNHRRWGYL